MPLDINGQGSISGITSLNTSASVNLSETELGYLDGVTSGLQTQINTKAADSSVGLVKIVDQSFTSASAVSVNNCFSNSFYGYKILTNFQSSDAADRTVGLRLRSSSVDTTTNYGSAVRSFDLFTSTTSFSDAATASDRITFGLHNDLAPSFAEIDILTPHLVANTFFTGSTRGDIRGARSIGGIIIGRHGANTSFDGITMLVSAGSISGSIKIYGYRN